MRAMKVSRAAVKRVLNPLPAPTICPNCGNDVELVNNTVIYKREFGTWPFAYRCVSVACDSYVGVHPKTDIPLGTLASKLTRAARKQAKAAFAPLWEQDGLEKGSAYAWLAEKMGIKDVNHCHVGWFNIEQCNRVIQICNQQRNTK